MKGNDHPEEAREVPTTPLSPQTCWGSHSAPSAGENSTAGRQIDGIHGLALHVSAGADLLRAAGRYALSTRSQLPRVIALRLGAVDFSGLAIRGILHRCSRRDRNGERGIGYRVSARRRRVHYRPAAASAPTTAIATIEADDRERRGREDKSRWNEQTQRQSQDPMDTFHSIPPIEAITVKEPLGLAQGSPLICCRCWAHTLHYRSSSLAWCNPRAHTGHRKLDFLRDCPWAWRDTLHRPCSPKDRRV